MALSPQPARRLWGRWSPARTGFAHPGLGWVEHRQPVSQGIGRLGVDAAVPGHEYRSMPARHPGARRCLRAPAEGNLNALLAETHDIAFGPASMNRKGPHSVLRTLGHARGEPGQGGYHKIGR